LTILESERLLFREHQAVDLNAFCDMQADPEVRRYVGGSPLPREAAERRFRERFLVPKPNRLALWATIYKPEGLYIGQCGVYPNFEASGSGSTGPITGQGTLGFYLARAYWGKGLATEAGRAFVNFGFNELGLARIVTAIEIGNHASVRVVEKLGFSLVRTELGAVRSFYHFELLRNQSDIGILTTLRWARGSAYTGSSCGVAPSTRFDFGTGLAPESGRVALA